MKRVMTENLKRFFTALTFNLIIMTLILAPVSYSGSSNAYAQEEKPGIYKVDSKFNKDLSKTDIKSVADASSNSIVKIVEQYVAAMFGVVMISSLNHKYEMRSRVDCPMNRTADVTLRLVQLSSLVYILSDIRANLMFEEASKIAVDKSFTAKKEVVKTDSKKLNAQSAAHENKQIAAYDALIKIYKKQQAALKTKLTGAAISEAGYITALVLEYKGAKACEGICKASYPKTVQTLAGILNGKLPAFASTATAKAAQRTTEKNVPAATACTALATQIPAYIKLESAELKKQSIIAKTEAAETVGFFAKTVSKMTSLWHSAVGSVKDTISDAGDSINSGIDSAKSGTKSFFDSNELPDGMAVVEAKKDTAKGVKAETVTKAAKVTLESARSGLLAQAQTCDPQDAYQLKIVLDSISTSKEQIQSVKNRPVFCCGSNKTIAKGDNGKYPAVKRIKFNSLAKNSDYSQLLKSSNFNKYTIPKDAEAYTNAAGGLYKPTLQDPVPFPSIMSSKVDVLFKGFSFGKKSTSLETRGMGEKEILKEMAYSLLQTIATEKVYKHLDSSRPLESIKKVAATTKYIKEILNNQNGFETHEEFLIMKETIAAHGIESIESKNVFERTVTSLSDLVVAPAHADGLWGQLLNIGVKLAALQFFLGKYVREYGLVKPYNRQWTWGIMSAVNGGLMFFNMNSLKEAGERLKRVKAEKERFMNSSKISNGVDNSEEDGATSTALHSSSGSDKDYSPSNVIKTCVVAQGDRLIPSKVCPSSGIGKTAQKNKLSKAVIKGAGPDVMNALSLVNATASEIGGEDNGSGGFSEGTLGKAQASLKAIRAQRDSVLKSADKSIKTNPFYKKGKLSSLSSQIRKGLLNLPNSKGAGTLTTFKAQSDLASIGLKKKVKPSAIGTINSKSGSSSIGFDSLDDIDLSDEDNSEIADVNPKDEKIVDNNEYVYNHDINENKDVSIFKLISNRAIKYYPVLLEKDDK